MIHINNENDANITSLVSGSGKDMSNNIHIKIMKVISLQSTKAIFNINPDALSIKYFK